MGEEVPLARKEEEGRSVLLAGAGIGRTGKEASCRDKGKEEAAPAKGKAGREIKGTKKAGKNPAADKDRDGETSEGKKHRGDYQARVSTRGLEGEDNPAWRSAEELGVEWFDHYCPDKPTPPHSHHLVGTTPVDGGVLFVCKYCGRIKWLPSTIGGSYALWECMRKYGEQKGYCIALDFHPAAKRLLSKVQNFYLLRKVLSDGDFAMAVAAIMTEKQDD